ncbi:16S rRNA (adenine(1518)-N(6)/adenine(1519)-N(6))-dimethyltransferase RsmA [Lachnospiraceae bacterium OttesenSCG-928-D06]|nr:16S rRNA (adenine(1518)-N(6)/adenine(1519)-N(6))-dimethyltransferase RsmA [Lachnospiraceae bacterium OttesenSCG-928-D06]
MANLGVPQNTIAVIQKHQFHFQKKYGQNFLIDENILHKIVASAEITSEDLVIEIGPGIGTLTQYLAEQAAKVIAVEIDKALIPILEETLSSYENIQIINNDILKLDLNEIVESEDVGRKIKVVANLPYYITTPIIMGLFESKMPLTSITVMIQTEVAQRMQAAPGGKEYGALSLAVQYYANTKIVTHVPPHCFMPRPKVGSSVIRLERYTDPKVVPVDEKLMFAIIRASFNQRRKTLVNGISNASDLHLSKEAVTEALLQMGLVANVRGETLSLEQFAQLSDLLGK